MEKLNRIKSLFSTKHPRGIGFEKIFTILMEEYLDRHSPENKIKRRNERKNRSAGRKKISAPKKNRVGHNANDTGTRREADRVKPGLAISATAEPRDEKTAGKKLRGLEKTRHVRQSARDEVVAPEDGQFKSKSRHIPQSVQDEVFMRDGGRCTFIGDDGVQCDSMWNLEIDHIVPFAKGGNNSPDNLRLLCAMNNRLAAEHEYRMEFMKKFYRRE
jgi:5-methylcytosine-specific restriction endonuclease McrA